jgi:hypothetical protein
MTRGVTGKRLSRCSASEEGAKAMPYERNEYATIEEEFDVDLTGGHNRRGLIGAAVSSFVAGASGLLLPGWLEETEAREGALGGAKGGRRGQNRRGRHKRRSHGDKKDKQKDQDKPRGACINVMDMTIIFSNGFARDHLMSVAHGGGGCNFLMKYRWINKVVSGNTEFQFVGWYPDMHLDLYSVSPTVHFEARNPSVGYPSMTVTKDDASAPGGLRTILPKQGFFVDEVVHVEGFLIKRQEDFDEHKVFYITPEYP